jgi:hypothetical protein
MLSHGTNIFKQVSRRKRMTLIAAFWCAGNQAVLCADSEECYGDLKTSVTKINPQILANGLYEVAFGGSGFGDLVDALDENLEKALDVCQARTEVELRSEIEKTIVQFYKSDPVVAYPRDLNDPNSYVSGVVCIRVVPDKKVFLFGFSKTIVLPVKTFILRGLEIPIYASLAKRLYQPNLLPLHAQLVGLRVLSEAQSTSTLVDSPFITVFAMTHGMFALNRNTDLYLKALSRIQCEMDDLLLACADTHAVSQEEARAKLRTFNRNILELRRDHHRTLAKEFKKYMREA